MKRPLLLVLLLTAACHAPEFDRGRIRSDLRGPARAVAEDEIAFARGREPDLLTPFRLAVHMSFPRDGVSDWLGHTYAWGPDDQSLLMTIRPALRSVGIVSDVVLMTDTAIEADNLKGLRLAAARYDADALLVVRGAADTRWYWRSWLGIFDIYIIGGFIFDASQRDALVITSAALWDVDSEHLYFTLEAEGEGGLKTPTYIRGRTAEAVALARQDALRKLSAIFVERLMGMREEGWLP